MSSKTATKKNIVIVIMQLMKRAVMTLKTYNMKLKGREHLLSTKEMPS